MSVYIFTLPKAGTYFLANLLSNMGLNDTGRHIFKSFFLDTHRFSLEENSKTPKVAKVKQFFVRTVRETRPDDVIFGHFPLPLNPDVAPQHMRTICSYRHPKKTLTAEFIDFRFRRSDVKLVSRENEPDDNKAFEKYLLQHGTTNHFRHFKSIVLYNAFVNNPLVDIAERNRGFFLNFDTILHDATEVERVAAFLGIDITAQEAVNIHKQTLAANTKTKAVDIDIDRDALWTPSAFEIFESSGFNKIILLAQEQGLKI